jgi:DtxR family Mn-dependent transcriptional regulator
VPNARNYLTDQGAIRLREAPLDAPMRILLVSEVVEDEEQLISYLHERGLTPGTEVRLCALSPAERTAMLRLGDQTVEVPERVAHALWVVPANA